MRILWDEPKRLANLAKHGLDFGDLDESFFGNSLVVSTKNRRWMAIGVSSSGIIVVVFVVRRR